jgi:hypothetical protein
MINKPPITIDVDSTYFFEKKSIVVNLSYSATAIIQLVTIHSNGSYYFSLIPLRWIIRWGSD